jgi:ribA/ribD-fused uncharacterized protein
VNVQDHDGNTPLHCVFGDDELRPDVEFSEFHALVLAGTDRSIKNNSGKTAYDLAVQWQYPDEYLKLLDPVAQLDPRSFIWLGSNEYLDFHPDAMVSFELEGLNWPSCEHYFKAQITVDPVIREKIRQAKTLSEAAKLLHETHENSRQTSPVSCDQAMHSALLAKFRHNEQLRHKLLASGNATLISDANCDSYWMQRMNPPYNTIGYMIMDIRKQLRGNTLIQTAL